MSTSAPTRTVGVDIQESENNRSVVVAARSALLAAPVSGSATHAL